MTARQDARSIIVAVTMMMALGGCHFPGKPKTEPIPVPDPPRPIAPAKASSTPTKPSSELPPPPPIQTKTPDLKPEVTQVIAEQPVPPKPKPKKKVVTKKTRPPVLASPPPTETLPATDPASVPKLGELISEDQRAGYLRACDAGLARARQALNQLKGVSLTHEQTEAVERIRTFIDQAEQARQSDPRTARQLADRADLLSRDLVRSVK
jgi:outer membrane biosynthesis protein TonB